MLSDIYQGLHEGPELPREHFQPSAAGLVGRHPWDGRRNKAPLPALQLGGGRVSCLGAQSFLVRLVSCLHSLPPLSKPSRERWNVRGAWNLRGGGAGVRPGSPAECSWASSSASPGLEEMTRAASQACCAGEITSGQKCPACCKMLSGADIVEPFFPVHLLCARQCVGFEGPGLVVGAGRKLG